MRCNQLVRVEVAIVGAENTSGTSDRAGPGRRGMAPQPRGRRGSVSGVLERLRNQILMSLTQS